MNRFLRSKKIIEMANKKSLLFYGELPPNAIHGIAGSNMVILKSLENIFSIHIIEEKSAISKGNGAVIKKLHNRSRDIVRIIHEAILQKFDFFYLTFSITLAGGMKTLLSIICFRIFNRGKVILHIHRGDFYTWYGRNLFNSVLANLVIKLSSRIIVLSDSQKNAFSKLFDKPVSVLHNTVEYEFDLPLKRKANTRFIFISNYLYEKGIIDLLDVFTKISLKYPDISLHTYGAFPNAEMKEKILRYRNEKTIIGQVITGEEKFTEIKNADCLVLPSFNEGEPIVLLEAMSVGTPIISTNVGLIPEMLGTDYPFLSLPGNQASLEKKMKQFINYPDLSEISFKLKERYTLLYSNKIHNLHLIEIFS